jgi:hypothetical protein
MKGKVKIEIAPTARSSCCNCGQYINKGHYRVLEVYFGRFTIKDKYCASCGINLIRNTIKELQDMEKEIQLKEKELIKNGP